MTVACTAAVWLVTATLAVAQPAQHTERDLAYGADAAQRLDLLTPSTPGFSTVVFVHGGSLTSGDKADADYGRVCEPFVAEGIACANVNYRLLPAAAWPAQAEDVAAAIAWIHRNIERRGGRPDRVFLLGHSSGAMLVALVAANTRYLATHQLTTSVVQGVIPMGSIMRDVDLQASIDKNGRAAVESAFPRDPRGRAFGSLEQYESQWPINFLRAGLPAYLFLIAESEQVNPPVLATNQKFVDEARALGSAAQLKVFAGRTHYSMVRRLHQSGDEVFASVLAFIRNQGG